MRLLSSGRGAVESAPEKTDYCLSVSVAPVVAVGASAPLDAPGFSEVSGSAGLAGALGVAAFRGLNQ